MTPELQQTLDVMWIVLAGALVFFMQAGFAMLEAGMVRSKNTVNVIMKNYTDMCFGAIGFWAIGYGLMFGANPSGWVGTTGFAMNDASGAEYALLFFQMMFAATAATIVSGALAERIRFVPYLVIATLISTAIYPVYGSWVWGGDGEQLGWLRQLGFIDFAGSTVVHSIGGWIALAGVIVLGPRLGRYSSDGKSRVIPGHSLPLVAFGGLILWLGWFGFNAGSTMTLTPKIGEIVLNTHLAGAAGVIAVVGTSALLRQPILMTETINGGLVGLVSITAGCATMDPQSALLTGFLGGWVYMLASSLLQPLLLDDVVGAVAVHGVGGAWGTLAAGTFHQEGWFNVAQMKVQCYGIGAAFLYAFPVAWLLFTIMDKLVGLRVDSSDERRGLDYAEHYELGYPEFQDDQLHGGKE